MNWGILLSFLVAQAAIHLLAASPGNLPTTEPVYVPVKSLAIPGATYAQRSAVPRSNDGIFLPHGKTRIIALNANLEEDWTVSLPFPGEPYAAIGPTKDGGFVVPFVSHLPGLLRFGSNSNIIFQTSLSNAPPEPVFAAELANGDTLAAFQTPGNESSIVYRLAPDGTVFWTNHVVLAGAQSKGIVQQIELGDGSILLAGVVRTNKPTAPNDTDLWFLKLAASGQPLWEKTVGTAFEESLTTVIHHSGTLIVGATVIAPTVSTHFSSDIWLLAVDPANGAQLRETHLDVANPSHQFVHFLLPADNDSFLLGSRGYVAPAQITKMTMDFREIWNVYVPIDEVPDFHGIVLDSGIYRAFYSRPLGWLGQSSGSIHCLHLSTAGELISYQDVGLLGGGFHLKSFLSSPEEIILAGFETQTNGSVNTRAFKLSLTNQPLGKPTISSTAIALSRNHYLVDQTTVVHILTNQPNGAIYYTTNGTTPTTASTPYHAPFTLNSNAIVRAIAVYGERVVHADEVSFELHPHTPLTVDCGHGGVVRAQFVYRREAGEFRVSSHYFFPSLLSPVVLPQGTEIKLHSEPAQRALLSAWSGDVLSHASSINFQLDKPHTIYTRFRSPFPLSSHEHGTVVTDFGEDVIPCGPIWRFAEPKEGYYHKRWEVRTSTNFVPLFALSLFGLHAPGLNEPIPVFEPLPPDTVSLSIQHVGPGEVSRASGFHPRGREITLTAMPGARVLNSTEREGIAFFTGWSGSIQSTNPVLQFRADSNMVLRATFAGVHDRSFIYAIPSPPDAQAQTSTNLTDWTPATDTYRFREILRYDSLIDSPHQFFRAAPPPVP